MALLYSKFQIFSCPQVLPPLPQLTEISEMLTIPNYYRPPISDFNLNCQPLSYLTSPCNWSLEHRFSRPKLKFWWHHINWFNVYFIFFSWGLTSYKFTKIHKVQIYYVQVQSLKGGGGGLFGQVLILALNTFFSTRPIKLRLSVPS